MKNETTDANMNFILWRFGVTQGEVRQYFEKHATIEKPLTRQEQGKIINEKNNTQKPTRHET